LYGAKYVSFTKTVSGACSYEVYGTLLDGRHGEQNGSDYRYGFQGQEADDEIKGEGNSYNYTYRMHDPRIGRFFAIDPLAPQYPWYTPYQFSGNKVIDHVELEGLEEFSTHAEYKAAYGDKAMAEDKWDGSDGAWLTSDRDAKNDRWKTAMGSITEHKYQGRLEAFEQVKDYYHYIDDQLETAGHGVRWTNGASYLVDELSLIYDEGGMSKYLAMAYGAAYGATFSLTNSHYLSDLAGDAAKSEMKSTFNSVKPILVDLNVAIADYAVTKFNDLLYGANKGTKLQDMDAYWYDFKFIFQEQIGVARSVYQKYGSQSKLGLMNLFFNYGEFNPFTNAPIPVPSGVDLTQEWSVYGYYGSKARFDIPMMMLWPNYHKTRTLTEEYLENQFTTKVSAGPGMGQKTINTKLFNKYQNVSKKINR
jgi:RHS repeat-associated protein